MNIIYDLCYCARRQGKSVANDVCPGLVPRVKAGKLVLEFHSVHDMTMKELDQCM